VKISGEMSVMEIWQEQSLYLKPQIASIQVPAGHELVLLGCVNQLARIDSNCNEVSGQSRKRLTESEPRYRQLIGAVILMAVRGCTYRDAEDLISFYAPARYLCDLMESEMGLGHVTRHPERDFGSNRK
jgi:hypothetical protein